MSLFIETCQREMKRDQAEKQRDEGIFGKTNGDLNMMYQVKHVRGLQQNNSYIMQVNSNLKYICLNVCY